MGYRNWNCPGTDNHPPHQFRHFHNPSPDVDPPPRFCPTCGCDGEIEDNAFTRDVAAPFIASARAKSIDQVYRQMETASEARMQLAAGITGQDVSDFNDMKITDLKDNLRPGDVAAMPMVANEVTKRMDAMTANGIPTGWIGNNGQGFAEQAHTGYMPHAGAGIARVGQEFFQTKGQAIVRASETGRH